MELILTLIIEWSPYIAAIFAESALGVAIFKSVAKVMEHFKKAKADDQQLLAHINEKLNQLTSQNAELREANRKLLTQLTRIQSKEE